MKKVYVSDIVKDIRKEDKSEYVIVSLHDNKWTALQSASYLGALTQLDNSTYKCKRNIANNLHMKIMGDYK